VSDTSDRAAKTERRWRRVFLGLYLTITTAACVVAFFSVLAVHCGGRPLAAQGPRIHADARDPRELRACQADLERLLRELHLEAVSVQGKALTLDTDLVAEWRAWSGDWQTRWRAVDYRCRLHELAGRGVAPEIDKMAEIHSDLDELQFAYAALVGKFAGTYTDRLRRLRNELREVRQLIDRHKPGATPAAHPDERSGATR